MARLTLTVQDIRARAGYPGTITANAADVAFTAAGGDFADGAAFANTGKELLLVNNPTGGALTVTVDSVAEPRTKRTGNISAYSVGGGELAAFGPFAPGGFNQTNGNVHLAGSAAGIEFAVLRLP